MEQNKTMRRGPMGQARGPAPVEKAKNFRATLKKLFYYLAKYKFVLLVVILCSILSTVFNIVGPKILGNITTEIYAGVMQMIAGTGGIDFVAIKGIVLILVVLYLTSAVFQYLQSYLMVGVGQKFTYTLRKGISEKINQLPVQYFDKKTHGEVLSYITNDVDTIAQNLNQSITQVITSITMLIGILVMMFSISWQMSLIAILVLPVSTFFTFQVIKKSQKYFTKQQEYLGHVNGHIEEMYANHDLVKVFNGEQKSIKQFNECNNTLYHCAWKAQFLSGLMHPIMNFIANIGYVIICIMGGVYAGRGTITVGNIQSFIQYMRQFTQPITQLANVTNMIQSMIAACERVFEFLDEEEEVPDTNNPKSTKEIKGNVDFEHVKFGYEEDKIIIKDFSAKVEQGKKIAIVGPTGAGKTTLVKLLMRYYDICSGEIKIDGIDIKDFKRDDLRSIFAMVLQDTWCFNGTIMENIRYGKLEATDEEVMKAAKVAQVDHFVRTFPEGYQTILNEDSTNISQGQKQLLTIARAFLVDPKILILDEATSSVDTKTEMQIQKAMDNLMKGRTSFVIAHRLSTVRDADLILVINEGDIIEQGTHEELLKLGGFYEKLYNSQF